MRWSLLLPCVHLNELNKQQNEFSQRKVLNFYFTLFYSVYWAFLFIAKQISAWTAKFISRFKSNNSNLTKAPSHSDFANLLIFKSAIRSHKLILILIVMSIPGHSQSMDVSDKITDQYHQALDENKFTTLTQSLLRHMTMKNYPLQSESDVSIKLTSKIEPKNTSSAFNAVKNFKTFVNNTSKNNVETYHIDVEPLLKAKLAKNGQTSEIPGFFKKKIFKETGYGHQKKRGAWNDQNFYLETRTPTLTLAQIPIVLPMSELTFNANESLSYVRTDDWLLPFGTCIEARFRLQGKRTRLLIYTCHMAEGGECTLNKFTAFDQANNTINRKSIDNQDLAVNGETGEYGSLQVERCVSLRPWMNKPAPFAFHIKFVRRPRQFGNPEKEERFMRRKRRLGRRATREVGRVELKGFKKCSKTCVRNESTGKWKDGRALLISKYSTVNYEINSKKRKRRKRLRVKKWTLNHDREFDNW